VKLKQIKPLLVAGDFTSTQAWLRIERDVRDAVAAVHWPPDSGTFTIYPESGKKRGEGNGVKPIKLGFITKLHDDLGWELEHTHRAADDEEEVAKPAAFGPGAFDAWLELREHKLKPFVVEWETGNISSSHRAMNKMAVGILEGWLSGGLLVLPSRELYQYLTDRVGNFRELEPYFPMWQQLRVSRGYLGVVEVEHDATSTTVKRIQKGTDGRALI